MVDSISNANNANSVIFVVDAMFNEITNWLRIFGYITYYMKDVSDDEILNYVADLSKKNRVVLITGDKILFERALNIAEAIYLKKQPVRDMLSKIFCMCGLKPHLDHPRCSFCNGILKVINKEKIKSKVPEKVYLNNNIFWVCVNCGHIYWRGSHWISIENTYRYVMNYLSHCKTP